MERRFVVLRLVIFADREDDLMSSNKFSAHVSRMLNPLCVIKPQGVKYDEVAKFASSSCKK